MIERVETQEDIENLYKSGSNAPYTQLQRGLYGYAGVLLANKKTGKVQCHICGEWKDALQTHIRVVHKKDVYEYKKEMGFPKKFPLCAEKVSEKRRVINERRVAEGHRFWVHSTKVTKKRTPRQESQRLESYKAAVHSLASENKKNLCHDQILKRVGLVADKVGHFPSSNELKEHDWAVLGAIERRWGSWNAFKESETTEDIQRHDKYTKEKILQSLREWTLEHKRFPKLSDFRVKERHYPSGSSIIEHCGSWRRALAMAGLLTKV